VKIIMLLRHFHPKGYMDFRVPGPERGKLRTEMLHQSLTREAFMNATLELRVDYRKVGMLVHNA